MTTGDLNRSMTRRECVSWRRGCWQCCCGDFFFPSIWIGRRSAVQGRGRATAARRRPRGVSGRGFGLRTCTVGQNRVESRWRRGFAGRFGWGVTAGLGIGWVGAAFAWGRRGTRPEVRRGKEREYLCNGGALDWLDSAVCLNARTGRGRSRVSGPIPSPTH